MLAPHGSQGNVSVSEEDLLSEHTATSPTPSPSLDVAPSRLCDMHAFTHGGLQPISDPVHESLAPHYRRVHTLLRLSEGALSAPAESQTTNLQPSALRQVDSAAVSDPEDALGHAYVLPVSAIAVTRASTKSPVRRSSVLPPSPPSALKIPCRPAAAPLTKNNQDNASPTYGCSMSIPSPSPACNPVTHRSSPPSSIMVACCSARGTEPEAVQCHQSQCAPPRTVAHKLLLTGCAADPGMPAVLSKARRSSYVSGSTMLGSSCFTGDGVESSDGGATATADTPLTRSNTSRVTSFSGAAVDPAINMANATRYTPPLLTATQQCRSVSARSRHTSSFSNKDDTSANASASASAVAEAALLPTPSHSPLRPPCAFSSVMASEPQVDMDTDNAEASVTAPAVAVASAMPSTCCLFTGPETSARRKDHSWFLPSFRDGSTHSSLSAAPQHLRACLTDECDRAIRALQRQEVWAGNTAAGREELRRQVEGHIVAKYNSCADELRDDGSAWKLPLEAPLPGQQLISEKPALALGDDKISARSDAAKAIAVATEALPSPAFLPQLIGTPVSFTGLRRGTTTQPQVPTSASTRSEPLCEQNAVSVESFMERDAVEESCMLEKSGLACFQQQPSHPSKAMASAQLPRGAPHTRTSVRFLGLSLSYEMALLAAAQEMSG
ncbi:hypothetical protein, unknown function [Leishmania tarentolae]|uniref:Uncharacterized protein n=1 Tax=Leishmania tarentolae TaxID=5689 RepID=A0A640KBJ5_LEITA|nr:hypothetical protein, unknown function [Leishmania tarentolae]